MNILVISSGNIVQLNKYSIYFSKQGHEVTFINPQYFNALTDRTVDDEFTNNGIEFYTWSDFDKKRIWDNKKFDCIFGTQHGATLQVLQYQKRLKIPVLLQILDIVEGSDLVQNYPSEASRLVSRQRPFVKSYPIINYLTGINPTIPKQIQQLTKRNDCQCIFYPVDTELFNSVPNQKTEDFVFIVSRHSSYKRIDLAIKACKHAGKKLVVGNGGDAAKDLVDFAKKIGADVEFLGTITDKQKAELMKKCKLHIFTQMWSSASGISPLEALYCKKPSIVFDYSVQKAIAGNYSYYITPGDWEAMGEKIKWIWENYSQSVEFASLGSEWVKKNLSPDVVSQQILDILVKIVNINKN
ncbi:MAG: glycosyltransferase [Candidatus Cloacimonetes bacterium]|nr:glycosyltransferase [Candidatus Cloacimonadota bacterium]